MTISRRAFALGAVLAVAACGRRGSPASSLARRPAEPPLHPNETPELRRKINYWADHHQVPRELVHRVIIRESSHRPGARNGPYYGLMQILPQTARTMGHRGPAHELLDADTNLKYAVRYLRGAYIVADGDHDAAVRWYARGYYYEARNRGLLQATGLR
ncbi:MAG: lytic transglycosylase domain-containing protein [Paracoccus sp. (in: a-proteobacteria)]|nr:lytic transglycosylase domain-containing protein [Paracoccus sp. (in: a-proteobacteria)]